MSLTYGDRIRSMTNKELADVLNGKPCPTPECHLTEKGFVSCRDCWLDYLNKEVDEDEL